MNPDIVAGVAKPSVSSVSSAAGFTRSSTVSLPAIVVSPMSSDPVKFYFDIAFLWLLNV